MKKRLDLVLVGRSLAKDQDSAARLVMAGLVSSNDKVIDKPGMLVDDEIKIDIKSRSAYVSKGGDKLESVAGRLKLNFKGKVVLDAGASTGGFSDYALQNGASKVYAVDVGRGQIHQKLKLDPRLIVMERTDIRETESLPEMVDVALVDVSFVSLVSILTHVKRLVRPSGLIVALLKPQFEASKEVADRFKGVISDEGVRQEIISNFESQINDEFEVLGTADSKVFGAKGNRERFYLLHLK